EAAEEVVDDGQAVGGLEVPRERLLPHLERLRGTRLVARDLVVILVSDRQALTPADLVALLVGELRVAPGWLGLAQVAVDRGEGRVGPGELRIQLDRVLEEADGLDLLPACARALPERERMQGLQRSRGGLLEGSVAPLDRAQRLAQGSAHAGRHPAE